MLAKLLLYVLCTAQVGATDAETSSESTDLLGGYRKAAIERWEEDIQELERLDQEQTDPDHAILFVGSSSIRRWDDMATDMKPWPTIRRGYGGAKFSDLAVFVERLVYPHDFDALVIFVANDVAGKDTDKQPEEVLELFKYVVERVRIKFPNQPIFFIAVTPTSSRFDFWPQIQKVNTLVREYSENTENLYFIETASHYLNEQGEPRDELFVDDRLHLNRDGYQLWGRLISAALSEVLERPKTK